ncbi:MAG: glycoside hydrolase family 13 protein [Bacilli bacterium]
MEKRPVTWWHRASVYQIYPLSFQDSNGDGIGDIPGIITRLDHLKNLGVDVIWLSPVFASPMKDNGYDVSDYTEVNPIFGTKADLKQLIDAVHQRGMKIISDIVLNHTSDQHPWFIDALKNPQSPYRDYYIFRKEKNDMQSLFSGPAWHLVPGRDEYYFHFFAKEQPDLNWQNPTLRKVLYQILNDWLAFGFDGFRLDVIDLIGKDIDRGIIGHGPYYHPFLSELKKEVFNDTNLFTVGELAGSTAQQAAAVTGLPDGTFSMAFQFSHLWLDEQPGKGKWALKPLSIPDLQKTFTAIDEVYSKQGWNALFMGNHDQPRPVSRYGSERHRYHSQTMLFLAFFGQRGTPFIYQGEEIGMLNYPFRSIKEMKDVESLNYYHDQLGKQAKATIMTSLKAKGRDNARTPMQWNDRAQAGFTQGKPWLKVHPLYRKINVKRDAKSNVSIQRFLTTLLNFRKKHDVFLDGNLSYRSFQHEPIYAYTRSNQEETLLVLTSFSSRPLSIQFPDFMEWEPILTNHPTLSLASTMTLPPYFGGLYRKRSHHAND